VAAAVAALALAFFPRPASAFLDFFREEPEASHLGDRKAAVLFICQNETLTAREARLSDKDEESKRLRSENEVLEARVARLKALVSGTALKEKN
jgi:hypothetical protein